MLSCCSLVGPITDRPNECPPVSCTIGCAPSEKKNPVALHKGGQTLAIETPLTFKTTAFSFWHVDCSVCATPAGAPRAAEGQQDAPLWAGSRLLLGCSLPGCGTSAWTTARPAGGSRGQCFCFAGTSAMGLSTAAGDLLDPKAGQQEQPYLKHQILNVLEGEEAAVFSTAFLNLFSPRRLSTVQGGAEAGGYLCIPSRSSFLKRQFGGHQVLSRPGADPSPPSPR